MKVAILILAASILCSSAVGLRNNLEHEGLGTVA